jgi:3-hydroxyisobutyrate dehydrogenase-like beta-hydroxyacid dehydrogenase
MRVAVVGLGAMGSRIAARLLEHGHEVVVWNRDRAKTEPLAERGALAAETPARAAADADATITMVADPQALEAVTTGRDGVAAGLGADATLIQMSTVSPAATSRVADLVADGALLDAPVLGSTSEVQAGTLKIFAGGPGELVERLWPLLAELGSVIHVGPVGSGTAAKLVANTTLVDVIGVLGEALAVAEALGLARDTAFEVLGVTPLGQQAERRRGAFESGDYPPRFALRLARKDADLILAAVDRDLKLTAAARDWLAEAEKAGAADADYSAVLARIVA